jgi:hypothetical protein
MRLGLLLVTTSLLLGFGVAPAQIVNTLEGFDPRETGWSGVLGGSLRSTGGNTEVFDAAIDARVQHRTEHQRWRAILGYAFESAGGVDQTDEYFGHLRHNHRLRGRLHSLAFAQVQHNPFQDLRSRFLVGAGARLDLVQREKARVSIGAAHMVENESLRGIDERQIAHRMSSFVDLFVPLGTNASFAVVTFVQPRWSDLGDVRAIASAQLESRVTGPLSLVLSANVAHDSEPPVGVERTDWTVRTGLRLRL